MNFMTRHDELLASALCVEGLVSEKDVLDWIETRSRAYDLSVKLIPLEDMNGWTFSQTTGNLSHVTGKFFSIQGLNVRTNFGPVDRWTQPIINQPEVGILGFISKRLNGVLHLLVQAKMEPGNINLVQVSPTVQATRSNYTQVHGGRRPKFVEYFIGEKVGRILLDQLQSEQGSRFLRKRNRNVIVQLPDNASISHTEDFIWLTIGQLQRLMRIPNVVHLDCRSIIGSLSFFSAQLSRKSTDLPASESFWDGVLRSILADQNQADHSLTDIISWVTDLKCQFEMQSHLIPLMQTDAWTIQEGMIQHDTRCFFSVVGVAVQATSREISSWHQPLIHSAEPGIIGLLCQMRNGVLQFLIQGRAEPGFFDTVELAPTVQCVPGNYSCGIREPLPEFVELFQHAPLHFIRFDSMLSDEGGRFYHNQSRHIIIELEPETSFDIPINYHWMTLSQIQKFSQFSNLLNIELRSILACVSPVDDGNY